MTDIEWLDEWQKGNNPDANLKEEAPVVFRNEEVEEETLLTFDDENIEEYKACRMLLNYPPGKAPLETGLPGVYV